MVGRGGRDYWTDIKLETLPDVSREHFRLRRDPASGQFFLKDLSRWARRSTARRRRPASNARAARSATAIWRRRCRRRRASVWRAWSSWSSEAHRMVKTKVRCAGASDPGRVRQQQRRRVPHRRRARHLPGGGRHRRAGRGREGRGDRGGAGARAAGAADRHHRTAHPRGHHHGQQRNSARRAEPIPNGQAWPACSRWPCWRTASAVVGHVGDSRLYQIRRGEIRKITHDHSPVGEREDSRRAERGGGDAASAPQRGVPRCRAARSTRPTTPISSKLQRIPVRSRDARCCCAATA